MNKHFIAFLIGIGIDKKVIDELFAHKDEDTVDLTEKLSAFKANQLTLYENDKDLVTKIKSAAKGELMDQFTRKLKSEFGLTAEQIKDKKIEEIISMAKVASAEGKDKPLQELEQQLMTANAKIKELEEVTIPAAQAKAEDHIRSFDRSNKFKSMFKSDEYRVPVDAAFSAVKTALEAKYDFDFDEAGELVAFQKGTKLRAKNKDNTGVLSVADLIKEQSTEFKFIKESNGNDGGSGGNSGGQNGTGTKIDVNDPNRSKATEKMPHLAAAEKALENSKALDAKKN